MSDDAIIKYLKEHKEHICVRMHHSQHNRELVSTLKKRKNIWWKVAAFLTGVFLTQGTFSQTPSSVEIKTESGLPVAIPTISFNSDTIVKEAVKIIEKEYIDIKGRVVYTDNTPVRFAKVRVGDSGKYKRTDIFGHFQIKVDIKDIETNGRIYAEINKRDKYKISGSSAIVNTNEEIVFKNFFHILSDARGINLLEINSTFY